MGLHGGRGGGREMKIDYFTPFHAFSVNLRVTFLGDDL